VAKAKKAKRRTVTKAKRISKKRRAPKALSKKRSASTRHVTVAAPKSFKKRLVSVAVPKRATGESVNAEAAYQVQVLDANKNISRGGALRSGETHSLKSQGKKPPRLVRNRFSAI